MSQAATNEKNAEPSGRLKRIYQWLPTLCVLLILASIGYRGHQSGWKMPKFSDLFGSAVSQAADWCEEHSVPQSQCIACNADLMPKGQLYGWCKEHGVHECVFCNPQLAQLKETAIISQADLDRAAHALALKKRPENDRRCKLHLRRIQFTSRDAVEKAGIDVDLVDRASIRETVTGNGQVTYDQTRLARLSVRVPGTVWSVEKNVGDHVHKGETLALVDAVEVGRAKSELLDSLAQLALERRTFERLEQLAETGAVPGKRILEVETAVNQARTAALRAQQALVNLGLPVSTEELESLPAEELAARLQFLGLPESFAEQLDSSRTTANLIPVTSPLDGVVVGREVVAGEVVNTTRVLFTVADTGQMWLMLNVPLEEARYVAVGQEVVFRPDGADSDDTGTITWISTDVDAETRTVMVRADVPNDDGHLRNETFGAGEIVLREEQDAIVVPKQSVHWEGCCHVVFVRGKEFFEEGSYKVFHTRMVRPGVTNGDYTEMIAGLLPGEVIVTKGSGVLRAELLKGNLGAG